MALKFILTQLGNKMGMDPSDLVVGRPTLLRFVNEAARELYTQFDPAGSLMEMGFQVNGDSTVSLPAYVGKIRAVRELASMQAVHINRMRPRYNQFNWQDMWRNYRIKYDSCLQVAVTNESIGILSVPFVETPPIVVSISGSNEFSSSISEQVVMDSTVKQTSNVYNDYTAIKKNRVNNYDITITDIDNKTLSVIPNNILAARYQIIDVSLAPWLPTPSSNQDNFVEVLYKRRLPEFANDDDEFPAFDFDDVIVNKCMQLWSEEQDKVDKAQAYDAKATRTSANVQEDNNRETEDVISLVANPHDTVLKRIGTGLRRRYRLYSGRKY